MLSRYKPNEHRRSLAENSLNERKKSERSAFAFFIKDFPLECVARGLGTYQAAYNINYYDIKVNFD